MGNEETRVNDTSGIMHEEHKNATIEQGKLMSHEPMDEDPGDASDLDRTRENVKRLSLARRGHWAGWRVFAEEIDRTGLR